MKESKINILCLNCGASLLGKYCAECGQASVTGRMLFSRLFTQDFLSNIFNLDRGFFRSCIDLIVRPGELVKNYLAGQRKSYFHFAGLLLILLTLDALLLGIAVNSEFTLIAQELDSSSDDSISLTGYERMYSFYKFILALMTPILALIPYLLLRNLGYFYSEHVVIAWFYLATGALVSILVRIMGALPLSTELYQAVSPVLAMLAAILTLRFYWKLSVYANYKTWSRTLRVGVSSLANILISSSVPILITWILSNY